MKYLVFIFFPFSVGGVILTAAEGRIVLNQTLDEYDSLCELFYCLLFTKKSFYCRRLQIAYNGVMPKVRANLFPSQVKRIVRSSAK
jgi:hypothetical protein